MSRTLPVLRLEGSQGGRVEFSDKSTKFVIEDASTQALGAGKVLTEADRKLIEGASHRPMASLLLGIGGLIVGIEDHP